MTLAFRGLAVVAVALATSAGATAQPPGGFELSATLTPRASRLAGVASRVYCAGGAQAWAAFMERRGFGRAAMQIYALTEIATHEAFLAPAICRPLDAWLRGRPVPLGTLADAIFTVTHEAAHLSGVEGECAADRWAFSRLARVARTEFGLRSAARVRRLVRLAKERSGYVESC